MARFDDLIAEVGSRFGLGDKAPPLLIELFRCIAREPNGFAGFLDRFSAAGLDELVESWIGKTANRPLAAPQVEAALGSDTVERIAGSLGVSQAEASSALAYAIPKVIDRVTPDRTIPAHIPAAITDYLPEAAAAEPATIAAEIAGEPASFGKLVWPALVLLGLIGVLIYLFSHQEIRPVTEAPSAMVAEANEPRLSLINTDGTIEYAGVVPDEATRGAIVDALNRAFGGANVRGSLITDPRVEPAGWLERIPSALALLRVPGVQALFAGNRLSIGGFIPDSERSEIIGKLKNLFGGDMVIGPLTDRFVDAVKAASQRTIEAFAALPSGYGAKEVVDALNLSIINFASGSAAVPGYNRVILERAAAVIQQLPAGTVIEIGGHTDSTGDEPANLRLSQERAEAVRAVLIGFGVDPARLTARGYGSTQPVASNDTPEGRFQNRRIAYAVVN